MSWLDAARARLRLLASRRDAETRFGEEIALHIEMETARLIREERLDPAEARRRALAAFGGVDRHTEALRDGRGLAWLGGLSLDLKLGGRMLVKYPGLTLVGGLAMAFAIWMGAVTFEFVRLVVAPTLPLPDGDRIVQLRNWDIEASQPDPRMTHDFIAWQGTLSSVTDLGAWRDESDNLVDASGDPRRVDIAAISASAFRVASGVPLLGRTLVAADEAPGAPPVIVLGYRLWRTRFAGDSSLVGRSVTLGTGSATVVGVMRPGFEFPVGHELWMPLRLDGASTAPRTGAALTVFGRLAPGVSLAEAQAELTTVGQRAAADQPATHAHLQPQVRPYARLFADPSGTELALLLSFNLFAALLLVLLCSNVALLLFARAATRESELIVRSALGASRFRIVAQLVAEALVLGGGAAAVGLTAAGVVLHRWGRDFLEINWGAAIPFWYDPHLAPSTVLYALGLTILGAVIAGAMPALKVTRGLAARLKAGTAGGGGLQFGGVWTAVIIAQVAFTVAFPAVVFFERQELDRIRSIDPGFRSDQYLGMVVEMDMPTGSLADTAAARTRYAAAIGTLRERLSTEPGVTGITFADRLPGMYHRERFLEVDGAPHATTTEQPAARHEVATALIDPDYFEVLRTPVLAGRAFQSSDLLPGAPALIVDQGFVAQVLRGRNAIGQRVRFMDTGEDGMPVAGPWHEIVGVVRDLGMGFPVNRKRPAGVYLPSEPAGSVPVMMMVHTEGDPMAIAPRVRAIAGAADAGLRLSEFQRVSEVADGVLWVFGLWMKITMVLTAIALLLSLVGIYAVLSFIVARRTREIGVRVALGASRGRVVLAIFRRPLRQVALGVVAGGVLVGILAVKVSTTAVGAGELALLAGYVALMFGVCLLACVVPTRRALNVEPVRALRAE